MPVFKWPGEIIQVLLRCILLQDGHLELFSFIGAFPRYSELVLIVSPPYDDRAPLGLDDLSYLQTLNFKHLRMPCFAVQDPSKLGSSLRHKSMFPVREEVLLETLRNSTDKLRIAMIPHCNFYLMQWSRRAFKCSFLARVIKHSDAVIVGKLEHEVNNRGLGIIQDFCGSLGAKPLKIYNHIILTQERRTIMDNIIQRFTGRQDSSMPFSFYKRGVLDQCAVPRAGFDPENIQNVIIRWNPKKVYTQGLEWYQHPLIEYKLIVNYRCILPKKCSPLSDEHCISNRPTFISKTIRNVCFEFETFRIPILNSIHKPTEEDRLLSLRAHELVLENMSWDIDNPFGASPCEHAVFEGVEFQADTWVLSAIKAYFYSPFSFARVSLIGLPPGYLHFLRWERTIFLQWKRLESLTPELEEEEILFDELRTLCVEGTSNELYDGSFKIHAPLLESLSIVMLPESTIMWELKTLLFHKPYETHFNLTSLTLKFNGSNVIPLLLKDILSVAHSLQMLYVKGLCPLFLDELQLEEHTAEFPNLVYLRLDSQWSWPPAISLNPTGFPCLGRLILETSDQLASEHITLMTQCRSLQFNPIPRTLQMIAIDRKFASGYQIRVEDDQVLDSRLVTGHGEENWGGWNRESDQSRFEYTGITRDISPFASTKYPRY